MTVAFDQRVVPTALDIAMIYGTVELLVQVRYHLGGASTAHESIPGLLTEAAVVWVDIFNVDSVRVTTHRLELVAPRAQAS